MRLEIQVKAGVSIFCCLMNLDMEEELGKCRPLTEGCASLGGHYNPRGGRHGSPDNSGEDRHIGDLGNIRAGEDGRARFRIVDKVVKVWDIIGRSVVVSSHPDDLGLGDNLASLTDGNCGPGLACGVIARAAAVGQNTKKVNLGK